MSAQASKSSIRRYRRSFARAQRINTTKPVLYAFLGVFQGSSGFAFGIYRIGDQWDLVSHIGHQRFERMCHCFVVLSWQIEEQKGLTPGPGKYTTYLGSH
jgi:hypothetical protein